jgi:hypothetical protein
MNYNTNIGQVLKNLIIKRNSFDKNVLIKFNGFFFL